mgnify:FL=1
MSGTNPVAHRAQYCESYSKDIQMTRLDDIRLIGGIDSDFALYWNSNTTSDEFLHLRFIESDAQSIPALVISDASFVGDVFFDNLTGPSLAIFNDAGSQFGLVSNLGAVLAFYYNQSTTQNLGLSASGSIFNEDSSSTLDFRIESDTIANMVFVDSSADVMGIGTGSPVAFVDIDPPNFAGSGGAEYIQFRGASQTIGLSNATTRTNQRQFHFIAPLLNGIVGGGVETFTNAATVYIDNAPTGTNSTITNASALWIDAGALRAEGRVLQANGANVASGSTITLGNDGNFFHITGTTNIDYITTTDWTNGSVVILEFDGILTVNDSTAGAPGGTANIDIGAVYASTANDTLTLVLDGGSWDEVSRSIN